MNNLIGTLAWRSPTGALLWEFWGRHKWIFPWQGAALAACMALVWWKDHGAPETFREGLTLVSFIFCLGAYLHLLTCFAYIEVDARKVQMGFPGRLLLKPVSTARLALTPMLFGGLITAASFAIWTELVLERLVPIVPMTRLWIGTALLSFFWWMQVLAWSLPAMRGRILIDLAVAIIHLLVGLLPWMPSNELAAWPWLLSLLITALPAAWCGLSLMRAGRWEVSSRLATLWSRHRTTEVWRRCRRFDSAFTAQFWFEWQRQGWLLPGITGALALVVFPCLAVVINRLGESPLPPVGIVTMMLLTPLMLSGAMGTTMAKFDPLDEAGELPVFIAVRPMTNGGFVLAKLAMALATSALTWLITVFGIGLVMWLLGTGGSFSKADSISPYGLVALLIGCVPIFLLLVILTWKNLVAGMGAGLTGRPWVVKLFTALSGASGAGLLALLAYAKIDTDFQEALIRWLPGVLFAGLVVKLVASTIAFVLGLRRKAITPGATAWICGGWLMSGVLMGSYAALVCSAIHRTDFWISAALAACLVQPLARLAIAPSALAWNRHR